MEAQTLSIHRSVGSLEKQDSMDKELLPQEIKALQQLKEEVKISSDYSERFICCCLIFHSLDVAKTEELLLSNKKWRNENGYQKYPRYSDLNKKLINSGFYFSVPSSRSKKGNRISYLMCKRFVPSEYDFKSLLEFALWAWGPALDLSRMDGHREGLLFVIDMSGIGLSNVDFSIQQKMYSIQALFPQNIAKMLILNPPWFFKMGYECAKMFVSQKYIDMVEVINQADLTKFIDEEELPITLGGKLNYEAADFWRSVEKWESELLPSELALIYNSELIKPSTTPHHVQSMNELD